MAENHHAGSATGIDLAALSTYDPDHDTPGMMEQRDTYKDGDYYKVEDVQAALARATPQHPDLTTLQAIADRVDARGLFNASCDIREWIEKAKAATPQHSVTEQADAEEAAKLQTLLTEEFACYRPTHPAGLYAWARIALLDNSPHRAQPLASTAATQPEQASDLNGGMHASIFVKVWGDAGGGDAGRIALANYAYDLGKRAALAIPASTAPTQQENEQANVLPPTRGTDSQHDAGVSADVEYMRDGTVKTWRQRAWEDGYATDEQPKPELCADEMQAEIDDLRTEISRRFRAQGGSTNNNSAPASTAASEQQASVSENDRDSFEAWYVDEFPGQPLDQDGSGEYATDSAFYAYKGYAAALSGRATIPSEADERARFETDFRDEVRKLAGAPDTEPFATEKLTRAPNGDYADSDVHARWEGWRAALTHRATTAAGQQGDTASAELLAAADAVVERWHSRDWKQPHTRDFIERLAAAVGAAKFQQGAAQPPQSDPKRDPKSPQSEGAAQAQAAGECAECDGKGFHRDSDENPTSEHECDQCQGTGRAAMAAPATSTGSK